MAKKQKPFTRKQRERMRRRARVEAAAQRRASRDEGKEGYRSLAIFKGCDPARTEALGG